MKYTKEITDQLTQMYVAGKTALEIAEYVSETSGEVVPERSIIAKLSSLGIYQKKQYLTKRGEVPVKKSELIERIAELLDVNQDILESLEKVNKSVLTLISQKLEFPVEKSDNPQTNIFKWKKPLSLCNLGAFLLSLTLSCGKCTNWEWVPQYVVADAA